MSELRRASTVVLLRERGDGLETFLVQRHRKSGFMPSAWVFPGGVVDPGDAEFSHPELSGLAAALELPEPLARAHAVAAVRETLEESGILLGGGEVEEADRRALHAGELSFQALVSARGLRPNLGVLRPWSWWITPANEPRRYDTRFFVAAVDADGRHDGVETVDSGWFSLGELREGADSGRFPMAPPTWWTLRELEAVASLDRLPEMAARRPSRPVQPLLSFAHERIELRLPGHPDHPEPAIPGVPSAIRYEGGRWWHAPLAGGD